MVPIHIQDTLEFGLSLHLNQGLSESILVLLRLIFQQTNQFLLILGSILLLFMIAQPELELYI